MSIESTGSSVPFVTNVTGGNVNLTYVAGTSPANKVVDTSSSDQDAITVFIEVDGGNPDWQPAVTINGTAVSNLTRIGSDNEGRRFSGSAAITMAASGDITVLCDDGATITIAHTRATGPEILTAQFDTHPTTTDGDPLCPLAQTAVKATDTVRITGTTDVAATEIWVKTGGLINGSPPDNYAMSGTTFDILVTVTATGSAADQTVTIYAEDSDDNAGADLHIVAHHVDLDNVVPTIPAPSIDYPSGPPQQAAVKDVETATANSTITNAGASPTYLYECTQGTELTPTLPSTYNAAKVWTHNNGTYRDSGTNCRITVTRGENGGQTVRNFLIEIAHVAPVVTVARNTGSTAPYRMGTDDGTNNYRDWTLYLNSNQKYLSAPDDTDGLVAPKGAWVASWSSVNAYSYSRAFRVADGDMLAGGQGSNDYSWTSCEVTNRANKTAVVVTTNPDYSLGGFQSRTFYHPTVFDSPSHEIDIGVKVVATGSLRAYNLSKSGSPEQAFEASIVHHEDADSDLNNYFTISNGSDVYGADGQWYHNSDKLFADSVTVPNSSQISVQEDP
jgi:hypothetical protein